jgi:hypothetical protein
LIFYLFRDLNYFLKPKRFPLSYKTGKWERRKTRQLHRESPRQSSRGFAFLSTSVQLQAVRLAEKGERKKKGSLCPPHCVVVKML